MQLFTGNSAWYHSHGSSRQSSLLKVPASDVGTIRLSHNNYSPTTAFVSHNNGRSAVQSVEEVSTQHHVRLFVPLLSIGWSRCLLPCSRFAGAAGVASYLSYWSRDVHRLAHFLGRISSPRGPPWSRGKTGNKNRRIKNEGRLFFSEEAHDSVNTPVHGCCRCKCTRSVRESPGRLHLQSPCRYRMIRNFLVTT